MASSASASVVKASRKGPAESHAKTCWSFPCRRHHSDQTQTLLGPSSGHGAGRLDDRLFDASRQAGFCRPASGSSLHAEGQHAFSCATGQSNDPPGPELTFDQAAAIAGSGFTQTYAGLRKLVLRSKREAFGLPSGIVLCFRCRKRLTAGLCLQSHRGARR